MINRIPDRYVTFDEFKHQAGFKEYSKLVGVFLRIIRRVKAIPDESKKKHYIRKKDLVALEKSGAFSRENPQVDQLQFPEGYDEQMIRRIKNFIDKKLTRFNNSGLDSKQYDCLDEPHFSISFQKFWNQGEKISIYLEAFGRRAFDLTSGQDKGVSLHWPHHNDLGINQNEMRTLQLFLNAMLPGIRSRKYLGKTKISRKHSPIPLSVLLVPDIEGKIDTIILLPKSKRIGLVGMGSFKKVKGAYDLTRGESLVKKYVEVNERNTVMSLRDQKHVLRVRTEMDAYIGDKPYYMHFERRCDGDLYELLKDDLTGPQKLSLIKDLLKALKALHKKRLNVNHNYFHGDIKPENILYMRNYKGEYKPYFTDFGFSNVYDQFSGTPHYLSPEHATAIIYNRPGSQVLGQELDVWGLGLVIAAILRGSDLFAESLNRLSSEEIVSYFSELRQEIVDRKIARAISNEPVQELKEVWKIVHSLLRVNPRMRTTAEDALAAFEALHLV